MACRRAGEVCFEHREVADRVAAVRWGRIVNVSSGIAARPGAMVGMNVYAAGKAALEAHSLNLAAELSGTGVTRQGLPARFGRHRHAGLDPGTGSRQDRRPPARSSSRSRTPRAP